MSELVTIGIDASLTRTALAALPGRTYAIVPTQAGTPLHFRLRRIAEDVYNFVAPFAAAGPVLVMVETPGYIPERSADGKGQGHSVEAIYSMGRAQGAALAGLPALPTVRAQVVTPAAWRAELKIKGGPAVKANVAAFMLERGIPVPFDASRAIDNDVADAYGLAMYAESIGWVDERRPMPGLRKGRAR